VSLNGCCSSLDNFNTKYPRTHIECVCADNVLTMEIRGELDQIASAEARKLILSMMAQFPHGYGLTVELGHLIYISSSGVGLLTSLLMEARKKQIDFRLGDINPKAEVILKLLGVLSFFPRHEHA
jgi:anti-anti-sigma factor